VHAQRELGRPFAVLGCGNLSSERVLRAHRWKIRNDPLLESIETKIRFLSCDEMKQARNACAAMLFLIIPVRSLLNFNKHESYLITPSGNRFDASGRAVFVVDHEASHAAESCRAFLGLQP
jgi:hypothetical protein